MRLTRQRILDTLEADTPTDGQDILITSALRYQVAADRAWLDKDMKLFRQMEKEFRIICDKLGILKQKEIKKKNLTEYFQELNNVNTHAHKKQSKKKRTKQNHAT